MAPQVTCARAVSVYVTNRTRRYTHRHKYSHLRGRIIFLKSVLGTMAWLTQPAVLTTIYCNTKLGSVLFIPPLEATSSIQVFRIQQNDSFVHAACPFYSNLDLISFMIFGESCKLENSSLRCYSPCCYHVISVNISLSLSLSLSLHLVINNAFKLCFTLFSP